MKTHPSFAPANEIGASEKPLQPRHDELQVIFDSVPVGIFYKDRNNHFIRVNRALGELLGRSKEELENKSCFEIFPRAEAEAFWKDDCEVMATGTAKRNIIERANTSEKKMWVQTDKVPCTNLRGEIVGVIGFTLDITDRKRNEEMMWMQSLVLDSLFEGVCLMDESGIIRLTNPSMDRMFGYDRGELIGQSVHILNNHSPEESSQLVEKIIGQARKPGEFVGEFQNRRKDGTPFVSTVRIFGLTIGEKNYFVSVQQDATEKKRLEYQILEVSDREQQRIGLDLHDGICQQLVSIAFAMDLVRQDLTAGLRPKISRLQKIKNRLDETIYQARNLSHELYPVNLVSDGLYVAIRKLARNVNQQCGVRCGVHCEKPVAVHNQAVATHLYRIVQEAVDNAIKHAAPAEISITFKTNGEMAKLEIADDGKGFRRHETKNFGIGLNIMRYRANMAGGSLLIQKGKSGGTVVTCHFPKRML
ncbi:MAG TPA: PAS domain S-box protein [Verrucomicrobiae bacterium]|nr:PAS domain S-box protein [Verrucomicrobiae bacterium]